MEYYSNQISRLIEEFSHLPGIGTKSAQRLAFHVINMPKEQVEHLAKTMVDARNNVRYCAQCCTLTDQELCPICKNPDRDQKTIMVVETPRVPALKFTKPACMTVVPSDRCAPSRTRSASPMRTPVGTT